MRHAASFAVFLAMLAASGAAGAVAVGGADPPPVVREEVYFVVFDPIARREHVLYAARLEARTPGDPVRAALVGMAVPARPEIAVTAGLDLPAAIHRIVAPYERAVSGRAPVAPAPWPPASQLSVRAVELGAGEAPSLDAAWLAACPPLRPFLAALDVSAGGARVELATPAVRVSFEADRPSLHLREPAGAPPPDEEPAGGASAPKPFAVDEVATEPAPAAPSADAVARILRSRPGPVRACYEAYLDEHPGRPATLRVEASIQHRGETRTVKAVGDAPETAALGACVAAAVKAKSFPRIDLPWKLSATLRFDPPRAPARQTHVVLLAPERARLDSPSPSFSLVREIEPAWDDVAAALPAEVREAVGLSRPGERLWLAQYLDRSDRRARAPDARWSRAGDVPASGEPGTLAHAAAMEEARRPAPAARAPAAAPRALSSRARAAIAAARVAALAVVLGLGLGRAR